MFGCRPVTRPGIEEQNRRKKKRAHLGCRQNSIPVVGSAFVLREDQNHRTGKPKKKKKNGWGFRCEKIAGVYHSTGCGAIETGAHPNGSQAKSILVFLSSVGGAVANALAFTLYCSICAQVHCILRSCETIPCLDPSMPAKANCWANQNGWNWVYACRSEHTVVCIAVAGRCLGTPLPRFLGRCIPPKPNLRAQMQSSSELHEPGKKKPGVSVDWSVQVQFSASSHGLSGETLTAPCSATRERYHIMSVVRGGKRPPPHKMRTLRPTSPATEKFHCLKSGALLLCRERACHSSQ